jgi:polyphosphate kinase
MTSPGSRGIPVLRSAGTTTSAAAHVTVSRYIDEDLSCLETGGRLLCLAEDETRAHPERLGNLAQAALALDEFFSFRGARLRRLTAGAPHKGRAVRVAVEQLADRQARAMSALMAAASGGGVSICDWEMLAKAERRLMSDVFSERLLPALAPLVTAPGQPLPGPAGLSLNVAVALVDPDGESRLGMVELPPVLERFVAVPRSGRARLVPLEQVVIAHLPDLFAGFEVKGSALYRVTRHGGVGLPPGAEDLLVAVEVASRDLRRGVPVRLEVDARIGEDLSRRLVDQFDLGPNDVYAVRGHLGLGDLAAVLCDPKAGAPSRTQRPVGFDDGDDPLRTVDAGDVVVLPDEPDPLTVESFLIRAARDPRVIAIKQTLFRPDPVGPVIKALMRAAERGMHVVVIVELAARKAERDSVACARALERAGAHVVYGLEGLRTHCLASLVVAHDGDAVRRYSLLSTGPHQSHTGAGPLGMVSADPVVSADMADLFNYLTGYSRPAGYRRMLVGPGGFRNGLLSAIRREAAAGPDGLIRLRVGRLVDRETIDALYAASVAGTRVEVLVGGACALRPGVQGLSERVSVRATATQTLVTSRCLGFGRGQAATWYLTSADLASRNLDRQVDVAVPIDDPWCAKQLDEWFGTAVDQAAWTLGPDGTWRWVLEGGAPGRHEGRQGLRALGETEVPGRRAASFGL